MTPAFGPLLGRDFLAKGLPRLRPTSFPTHERTPSSSFFPLSPHRAVQADRAMQQSRTKAIQALRSPRCFSTSTARAAASPYRQAQVVAVTPKATDATRTQSTVAAAKADPRARPAPAFNREDYNVQPLRRQQPEMDHSLVGLKGGEIFHEMMLRHGVKHVCTSILPRLQFLESAPMPRSLR